ncbi:MAG: hypothetical protein WKF63_06030 [Thermomicrobiales bacterium]
MADLLNLFVYMPLQRRNLVGAVVAFNFVGEVIDSSVFLTIAFRSLALLQGQIIGKAWMTLVAIPAVYGIRQLDRKRGVVPFGVDPLAT